MSKIVLDIPDDSLSALNLPREQAGAEIRLAAAVKLYELGKLSSGTAAHLAGLSRTVFLSRLVDFGVDAFRLSQAELEQEMPLG